VAQYKNVLSWLETKYLNPAVELTRTAVDISIADDSNNYPELKELEKILEEALEYIRRHQN